MYQNTLNVITAFLIEGNSKERNIFLTLGLEELILLKWSYYPKHSPLVNAAAAAAAKSLQSCPTLCDPRDGSPPGSPVPGILQARTLECIAVCFSNARK